MTAATLCVQTQGVVPCLLTSTVRLPLWQMGKAGRSWQTPGEPAAKRFASRPRLCHIERNQLVSYLPLCSLFCYPLVNAGCCRVCAPCTSDLIRAEGSTDCAMTPEKQTSRLFSSYASQPFDIHT